MADRLAGAQHRLRSSAPATELIDAQAAATLLNVPDSWIYAQARENRIPHVRLGRYVRFEPDALRAWWRAQQQGPGIG